MKRPEILSELDMEWICNSSPSQLRLLYHVYGQQTLIWAATWQNQQSDCAPSKDSVQPGHPPSLIRVFGVHLMGSWGPKLPSCGQRRLWSDWADIQADLSLRSEHTHFAGFVMSQLICFSELMYSDRLILLFKNISNLKKIDSVTLQDAPAGD